MNYFGVNNFKSGKTKGWIIFFVVFFIVFSYVLFWLLFGEIDLLNLDWFITPFQYKNNLGEMVQRKSFLSLNIVYICLSTTIFYFLIFLIAKKFWNALNIDIIPFIFMGNSIGITLIFTGLIPYSEDNGAWIILARFIIIITSSLFLFFISNSIVTKFMLSGSQSAIIYEEIKSEYKDLNKMKNEQNIYMRKKNKEKNYIEINEE